MADRTAIDVPDKPRRKGWMLATGLLLVIVGLCFLLVPLLATLAAGVAAGALLLVAGAAQLVDAWSDRSEAARGWGWGIALGVLSLVAGVFLLIDPLGGMVGFTLLLAGYLLGIGALKLVTAMLWSPVPGWGWMLFNGAISLLLGALIVSGWPGTGLWTVGVFLGVDALLAGFSRIVRSVSLPELGAGDEMIPTPRA